MKGESASMFNYSYVTLVTKEKYLIGANYLYESLKQQNSKYPLLVLVTDNLNEKTITNILKKEINYKIIPYYCFQKTPNVEYSDYGNQYYNRYKDTINKFQSFELIEYDKIIYLDADLYFYSNIDFIFDQNLNNTYFMPSGQDGIITGGTFLISPIQNKFSELLNIEGFIYSNNDEEASRLIIPEQIAINSETLQPEIVNESYLINNYMISKYALHFPGEKKYWEFLDGETVEQWKNYDKYKMREIGDSIKINFDQIIFN